jgi:hypothetical protein
MARAIAPNTGWRSSAIDTLHSMVARRFSSLSAPANVSANGDGD